MSLKISPRSCGVGSCGDGASTEELTTVPKETPCRAPACVYRKRFASSCRPRQLIDARSHHSRSALLALISQIAHGSKRSGLGDFGLRLCYSRCCEER